LVRLVEPMILMWEDLPGVVWSYHRNAPLAQEVLVPHRNAPLTELGRLRLARCIVAVSPPCRS
jgi:hypothetical protein